MTPVDVKARLAFIKERRHGKELPKLDFPGMINESARLINERAGVVFERPALPDITAITERRQELERICAASRATLAQAKRERDGLQGKIDAVTHAKPEPPEQLLSHLGTISTSFGGN